MEINKAIKQLMNELHIYEEYMECYDEYKVTYPEHAKVYHAMAQEEFAHAKKIVEMYPELQTMIDRISKYNNPKHTA